MSKEGSSSNVIDSYDAIIIGAGFSGLYMLHALIKIGLKARVLENADGIGGTWYWNRYPGARCDAESLVYSYSFSEEIEQEWEWTERYATQPEILQYIQFVAEKLNLNRHIDLSTRAASANFNEENNKWTVVTEAGAQLKAQFCIMATGCLSAPSIPNIEGLGDFAGDTYYASQWPHSKVQFEGKTVGIIGTGSSAIQAIPVIAEEAKHLTVFQRTANFSVPANNKILDPTFVKLFKTDYSKHRAHQKEGTVSGFGGIELPLEEALIPNKSAGNLDETTVNGVLEEYWNQGGARFQAAFNDVLTDPRTNELFGKFVKTKIKSIVDDPAIAELLCPTSHPFGTKRICVDTNYFETFNRSNVKLVDIKSDPISRITKFGLLTEKNNYEFDALILATGFDAMTGALNKIDIVGKKDQSLSEKWSEGPKSYLGLSVSGFPNLFTITGPGSPSVLSNMLVSIEQHVEWLTDLIRSMMDQNYESVEADCIAETRWVKHVNEVADATLYPQGGSWYLGANIPDKPRIFMPYAAGVGAYRLICDEIKNDGYRGFNFS